MYLFIYLFIYFICCSSTVIPISPLLLSPAPPTPYSHSQLPHCCPWPRAIYTCPLTRLFPFFPPSPSSSHPSGACQFAPCFHASSPFFSFVCSVHLVPVCEIIWYLSFTAWLLSRSTMLSSSTHAVEKGRSSFFLCVA